MTLVSIITPSFNQAPYLEHAILSVLSQDHADIEYILIDGGSTDGSLEIVRKYRARLAHAVSERDAGQADAINKGIAQATGDIVAWINSDDYYMPGAIKAAVRVFEENPDLVFVYGNMLAVDQDGRVFNKLIYRQLTLEDLLCFQIIGQPAVFMRRSALKDIQLDPSLHLLLDHHLWLQLAQHGRILHVDQTWAAARYHASAKNRARAAEFGREAFKILAWAEQQDSLRPILSPVIHRARASAYRLDARYLLDGDHPGAAVGAWTRALFLHPPTALSRLNILVSSLLNLFGLAALRQAILDRRKAGLQ